MRYQRSPPSEAWKLPGLFPLVVPLGVSPYVTGTGDGASPAQAPASRSRTMMVILRLDDVAPTPVKYP
jgi:hypothetical protein